MANELEACSIALANMDIVIAQRLLRFTNTFFTVMSPHDEPGESGRFNFYPNDRREPDAGERRSTPGCLPGLDVYDRSAEPR